MSYVVFTCCYCDLEYAPALPRVCNIIYYEGGEPGLIDRCCVTLIYT